MGDRATETPLDPYDFMKITKNSDGSLTRPTTFQFSTPTSEDSQDQTVVYKDISLNSSRNTLLRVFRPAKPPGSRKLPIIIFYHGGGFILYSAITEPFLDYGVRMASELNALVVSVEYRLAPESRLPAAYDDAIDAILWVRAQATDRDGGEAWLKDFGDFSSCFLVGSSSGANIVYHAGLRAMALDLEPLKVVGLFFDQPFFGGVQRSESELRLINNWILPLPVTDLMWELALPLGVNRDHEYCNPMVSGSDHCAIGSLPRCLVRGHKGDPLFTRQREFAKLLEEHGVTVVTRFDGDGYHSIEMFDPLKRQSLYMDLKDFVYFSTAQ